MSLLGLLLLTTIFACGSASQPNCPKDDTCKLDLKCSDTCFLPPSGESGVPYQNIYQVAKGIGSMHGPCSKPKGTAFLVDASAKSQQAGAKDYGLQILLAAIIAMVQPVSHQSNPICFGKYLNYGAFYRTGQKLSCKDTCQASRYFQSQFFQDWAIQNSPPNHEKTDNSLAQFLAEHCFSTEQCATNTNNQLLLFFTNSPNSADVVNYCDPKSNGTHYQCAVVGVTHDQPHLDNAARFSYSYNLNWVQSDPAHLTAATNILDCMHKRCCPPASLKGRDLNEANDESIHSRSGKKPQYTVAVLDKNGDPVIQQKSGTQFEIFKAIEAAPIPGPPARK